VDVLAGQNLEDLAADFLPQSAEFQSLFLDPKIQDGRSVAGCASTGNRGVGAFPELAAAEIGAADALGGGQNQRLGREIEDHVFWRF